MWLAQHGIKKKIREGIYNNNKQIKTEENKNHLFWLEIRDFWWDQSMLMGLTNPPFLCTNLNIQNLCCKVCQQTQHEKLTDEKTVYSIKIEFIQFV